MRLTPATIRTLKLPPGVKDKTYWCDTSPGFGVRLREGGAARFIVQYDVGTATRRVTLGRVGAIDLSIVRRNAMDILAKVRLGQDPATEKAAIRERASETFGALLPRFLDHKRAGLRPRSFKETERHLVKYSRPLHSKPVKSLDRRTIGALLSVLTKQAGPTAAHMTRASLSGYCSWLMGEGFIDSNPVTATNRIPQGKPRDRVLTLDELHAIWEATAGDDEYSLIVRLLILIPARKSEIGFLMWDEIDLAKGEIAIPASRMKGGRLHTIPLSKAALAILKARPHNGRPYVFGVGEGGFSGWSRSKAALDRRISAAGHQLQLRPWVLHDLRRSFATLACEELGGLPHIVEAALAHIGSRAGIPGIYNRALYVEERRELLERWAAYIEAKPRPSNVVKLARR
jgi:integrase